MWRSRARSRTKSTSHILGAVRGVQWTFSIHSAYLLKSQSENRKLSWSVWIIINGTLRRKIFRITHSAQKTRKTHKNYELRKTWLNNCVFKWALNCKKFLMLRRLLGSEFQTVGAAKWNERSPADLRLTRRILSNFHKMIVERVVVDKCAKQKTDRAYRGRVP